MIGATYRRHRDTTCSAVQSKRRVHSVSTCSCLTRHCRDRSTLVAGVARVAPFSRNRLPTRTGPVPTRISTRSSMRPLTAARPSSASRSACRLAARDKAGRRAGSAAPPPPRMRAALDARDRDCHRTGSEAGGHRGTFAAYDHDADPPCWHAAPFKSSTRCVPVSHRRSWTGAGSAVLASVLRRAAGLRLSCEEANRCYKQALLDAHETAHHAPSGICRRAASSTSSCAS